MTQSLTLYISLIIGDNPWRSNDIKSILQPKFREAFSQNINNGFKGNFLYDEQIGTASSRPFGTNFEGTSYALIHENTLIVTINVLYQKNSSIEIGETGTVTGTIDGAHLAWFRSILQQGRLQNHVKHVFVQGHFPVLFRHLRP